MTKLKSLTRNEKLIITINLLYYILSVFINIFFVAKFIRYTNDNLLTLCLYYIVAFTARAFGGILLGFISKTFPEKNKNILKYSFIFRAIMIILIIFLNESTQYYFLILGLAFGLSEMSYHFANDTLSIDVANISNRSNYINTKQLLINTLGIIVPYFLGVIMVNKSFAYCGYLMLIVSIIAAILCNFIKVNVDTDDFYDYENEENNKKDTFKFFGFINRVFNDKLSLISAFYFSAMLYGMFESAMLTTRLYAVLTAFKDMDNFGLIYSIFSLFGFITICLYKKYNKNYNKKFIVITSVMIFVSLLAEIYNFSNSFAAILFGASLNVANIIIGSMYSTVKGNITTNYNLSNYSAEYLAHQTLYQNLGRIISYALLLLANLSGIQLIFRIVMVILALSGIITSIILNYIDNEIGSSKFN